MLIGSEFKEEIKWAQISLSDFFWSQRCIGSTILDAQRFPHTCGTQSVVSGLPTSEAPRNLWGMEVLRAYPGLNQTQGTAAVCGLTSSWGFYVLSRMTISVLYLLHYGRNKTPMVTAGLIVSQCGWQHCSVIYWWHLYMCPVFMNLLREEKTEFAKVDRPSKLLRHSAFFSGVGYGIDKRL